MFERWSLVIGQHGENNLAIVDNYPRQGVHYRIDLDFTGPYRAEIERMLREVIESANRGYFLSGTERAGWGDRPDDKRNT